MSQSVRNRSRETEVAAGRRGSIYAAIRVQREPRRQSATRKTPCVGSCSPGRDKSVRVWSRHRSLRKRREADNRRLYGHFVLVVDMSGDCGGGSLPLIFKRRRKAQYGWRSGGEIDFGIKYREVAGHLIASTPLTLHVKTRMARVFKRPPHSVRIISRSEVSAD